jgi:glycyl-tRNA synthetase (class II)
MQAMRNSDKTMDKITAQCKNRALSIRGSEIYGGLANSWELRPLGVELIKQYQARLVEEIRPGVPL